MLGDVAGLTQEMRVALQRVQRQAQLWREEPLYRIALRNRLLRPRRKRQFHSFGEHSFVDRPGWLYGTDKIAIGSGVMIFRGAWLSVERSAWDLPSPVLDIRDRVGMRNGCAISASRSILIEEDVLMGAGVTIVDSKHTWSGGHPNALYNPVEAAPVRIGRGTWLAERVVVAAGADIGEQCAIGANTTVTGKVPIPDYSLVMGNPGKVVGSTRS